MNAWPGARGCYSTWVPNPGCLTLTLTRYTRLLQYMGAHVIPSFNMMRAFTLREPYDFVVVARRDTFAAVRRPNAPHAALTLSLIHI